MGWKPSETQIQAFRSKLAADPASVVKEIRATLKRDRWTRTERARLRGLEVAGYAVLGDYAAADRAYHLALRKPVTLAATAEVQAQYVELCATIGTSERLAEAADIAPRALEMVRRLPIEVEPGHHPATRRRRRWNRYLFASTLVIAGNLARLQGDHSAAFDHAREAFTIADSRSGAWLGAVSLLAVICLNGPPTVAPWVLALVRQAREAIRSGHGLKVQRLKLRWIEALAHARLGSEAWAERVLADVIPKLHDMGRHSDLVEAIEHYLWAVARSSKLRSDYHRAELERRYGPLGTDT